MQNLQPIEKPVWHPEGKVEVHSMFRTIQGEGPLAGSPAIFIRLTGCNLQCPGCDTEYTKNRKLLTPDQVTAVASALRGSSSDVIVITGGEPLRQDLRLVVDSLLEEFPVVQIETNGTLYQPFNDSVMVVVSPKSPNISPAWDRTNITAMKYVVEHGKVDDDGFPNSVLGRKMKVARPPEGFKPECIYIQPMDDGPTSESCWPAGISGHTKQAVDVCLKHGYRLCLQTHKLVGLP